MRAEIGTFERFELVIEDGSVDASDYSEADFIL